MRTNGIDRHYVRSELIKQLDKLEGTQHYYDASKDLVESFFESLENVKEATDDFYHMLNIALAEGKLLAVDESTRKKEDIFHKWSEIVGPLSTENLSWLMDALELEVCKRNASTSSSTMESFVRLALAKKARDEKDDYKRVRGAGGDERSCRFIRDICMDILTLCLHKPTYELAAHHNWLIGCARNERPSIEEFGQGLLVLANIEFKKNSKQVDSSTGSFQVLGRLFDRVIVRMNEDVIRSLIKYVSNENIEEVLERLLKQSSLGEIANLYGEECGLMSLVEFLHGGKDQPRLFICYAQSDGSRVVESLVSEILAVNKETKIYTDKHIQAGHSWLPVISHMIDLADNIVVVVSDDALTNQVYWTGFIRNYESEKIQHNTSNRRGASRSPAKLRFVDVTEKYKDSSLVSHVYGKELQLGFNSMQRVDVKADAKTQNNRILSAEAIEEFINSADSNAGA